MARAGLALALLLAFAGTAYAADLELQPKARPGVTPALPQTPALTPPEGKPQTLQSPETLAPSDKAAPAADKKLNDLQMPDTAGSAPGGESWWQQVVRKAPGCKKFSDGCRTCDAGFQCSSLPIACQPKEFACIDPKAAGQ